MYRCVAPNCKMRTYKLSKEQLQMAKNNYIVSFHKFPDDADKRKCWIEAAGKKDWNPPNYSSLCSLHFKDDCFSDSNELSGSAIPTIFFNDFRSHIKKIVDDFEFQCGSSSENEDDEKDVVEFKSKSDSEDDFNLVECEEIMVVEEDDDDDDDDSYRSAFNSALKKTPSKPVEKQPAPAPTRLGPASTERIKKSLNKPSTKAGLQNMKLNASVAKKESIVQPKKDSTQTLTVSEPFAKSVLQLVNSISSTDDDEPVNVLQTSLPTTSTSTAILKPATESAVVDASFNILIPGTEYVNVTNSSVVSTLIPSTSSGIQSQPICGSVDKDLGSNPPLTDSERIKLLNQTFNTPSTSTLSSSVKSSLTANVVSGSKDDVLNASSSTNELENFVDNVPPVKVKTRKPNALKEKNENIKTVVIIHNANIDTKTESGSDFSIVNQLLKVVNLATNKNENRNRAAIYLVTTKVDLSNEVRQPKIISLEPAEIIQIIIVIIQGIKRGTTQLTKKIVMLCGNPAIFFLKDVSIKNCDNSMNCVYIITHENLLPFMWRLKETNKKSKRVIKEPETKSVNPSVLNLLDKLPSVEKNLESTPLSDFTPPSKTKVALNPLTTVSISSMSAFRNTRPTSTQAASASSPHISSSTTTRTNQSLVTKSRLISVDATTRTNPTSVSSPPTTPGASVTRTNPFSIQSPRIPSVTTTRPNPPSIQTPRVISVGAKSHPNFSTPPITRPEPAPVQNRLSGNRINVPTPTTSALLKTPLTKTVQCTVPFKPSTLTTPFRPLQSPRAAFKPTFIRTVVPSSGPKMSVALVIPPQQPTPPVFTFRPIQPSTFISNLPQATKTLDSPLAFSSPPSSSSQNLKRVHDDSDSSEEMSPKKISVTAEYVEFQQQDIRALETTILKREREIVNLKKKMSALKRRMAGVRNPLEGKTDEELVEEILSKYLDVDAVQFFMGQMKVSGKTYTQFRWTEEDKLFALGLLYKNPVEYNLLFQKYTLPSDKTLTKFVARIKKAELEDPKFNYRG